MGKTSNSGILTKTLTFLKSNPSAVVIVVFAIFGLLFLSLARASSPFVSIESESTTLASGANIGTDVSASGGEYVEFSPFQTGNACLTQPSSCGFPDETNTGPYDESLIPAQATGEVSSSYDGQVIENFHATRVQINHANVTLRNFRITNNSPDLWYSIYFKPIDNRSSMPRSVIEYGHATSLGEVPTANKFIGNGSHFDARFLELEYVSDGFIGSNFSVENCYLHNMIEYTHPTSGLTHPDGVQILNTGNVVARNNTILVPNQQTSTINIVPLSSAIDNVLVENNLLNGGAYTIYSRSQAGIPTPTNVSIRNNAIGRDYIFGILSDDNQGPPDLVWEGNYWVDTGDPINN